MIERIALETVIFWIDEFSLEKQGKIVSVPNELRPVILGMVSKESTFNPKAPRFEPHYEWIVNADHFAKKIGISRETEIAMQRFSYGLLQVMGANCRSMGFPGYLFDLTNEHQKAFNYGVRYFLSQVDRYDGNVEKALSAYNAGFAKVTDGKLNGQLYADDVLQRAGGFRKNFDSIA